MIATKYWMSLAATLALFSSAALGADKRVVEKHIPDLGINANLHGKVVFPANNPWNTPIDKEPVDPMSDAIIAKIGANDSLHANFGGVHHGTSGIPYVVVRYKELHLPDVFADIKSSDPGPYPIPINAPVEGGLNGKGDRHVIVVDADNWKLYEMSKAYRESDGWSAQCGAVFDLSSNEFRGLGKASADGAGLPIFPGLVRTDEVLGVGAIAHALRFTVRHTRHAYVPPARHYVAKQKNPDLPPMGMRVRLKVDFDISHYPAEAKVILTALKKYGMILADQGPDWNLSGTADLRWDDAQLDTLEQVKGSDFEVVQMTGLETEISN